jgi:hypothetical protein
VTPTHTEPVLGWRLWHVDRKHRLRSWSQGGRWPERERFEALCRRPLLPCAEAPGRGHGCGIYALRTREQAETLLRELPLPVCGAIAVGRVSLWGRVVENTGGWRAQFAYPYEVFLLGDDRAAAQALRARYAVDVSLTSPIAAAPRRPASGAARSA